MARVVTGISITYLPQNNHWVLLRGAFFGEYDTFSDVLVALAKAKWFENWD